MNVFQRMLWKEYRAWRTLWLGCVLGTIGLEAFLVLLAISLSHGRSGGWTMVLLGFAQVVPAIYILACTAATFAGEREERTADWLTAMAPKPGPVIAAKLLFAAASGLLMQIALLSFAAALSPLDVEVQNGSAGYADFMRRDLIPTSTCLLLEAIVWGVFWAMWTTHPLRSVVLSAATVLLVNFAAVNLWQRLHGAGPATITELLWGPLRTGFTLAVLVLDIVLARQWLRGRYLSWPERAFLPSSRFLKVRRSATEAASAWRRIWQRLWWLELVHLRGFAALALLMTIAAAGTLLLDQTATLGLAIVIGAFVPMFGGLAAWQGEQRREQFRFHVDRGVSLAGLWLNKLFVWMIGSLLATAFFASVVIGCWTLGTRFDPRRWPELFPLDRQFPRGEMIEFLTSEVIAVVTIVIIGFLCGQSFRRGVVAFGLALMGTVALGMALAMELNFDLPMLWFAVPIPLWLVWISGRQLSRTWREQWRWPSRASLAAELMVPPLVWCIAAAGYRVYSVPLVDPEHAQSVMHHPKSAEMEKALKESPAMWSQIAAETRLFSKPVMRTKAAMHSDHDEPRAGSFYSYFDVPSTAAKYHDELQTLSDHILQSQLMSPEAAIFDKVNLHDIGLIVLLFGYESEEALVQENADGSAKWLRAAMRLAGRVTAYAPSNAEILRREILDEVVQLMLLHWAQQPAQTERSLRLGLTACAEELGPWTVSPEDLIAEWKRKRVEMSHAGGTLVNGVMIGYDSEFRWCPWELWRAERELAVMYTNQINYLWMTRNGLDPRPAFNPRSDREWFDNPAWHLRDRNARFNYYYNHPLGLDPEAILNLYDRETRYHGLCTAAAIAGFARVHGHLPISVNDIAGYFGDHSAVLRDPWSGEDFRFLPEGIPRQALSGRYNSTPRVTDPDRSTGPIVWSVGPEQLQLERTSVGLHFRATEHGPNNLSTGPGGTRMGALRYAFVIPAAPPVEYARRD